MHVSSNQQDFSTTALEITAIVTKTDMTDKSVAKPQR